MLKVHRLITQLKEKDDFALVNNFYRQFPHTANNLSRYFHEMLLLDPDVLLIGEAPGIHGCYLTGVPFTSEKTIKTFKQKHAFFQKGYEIHGMQGERTSTVMWTGIARLPKPPLLWNIMPLHPYKLNAKGKMQNRTPNRSEIQWGKTICLGSD